MSNGDLGFLGDNGFDPNAHEPQEDFVVLPPGKYPVMIEAAEVKQTKKGDGHYLELTMKVIDGPSVNRKLWDRINIDNPSQKCVEIGLRVLSALAKSTGLPAIQDTSQLVDKCCLASVKVKDNNNEVRTYLPIEHAGQAGTVQQQCQAPPQQTQQPPAQQAPTAGQQAAPQQQAPPAQVPVGNPGFQQPPQQAQQQQPTAGSPPPWARPQG